MKIVFLDFDGVLNSDAFFRAQGNRYLPETLDDAAVARLDALVAKSGARVVITSTWRLGYSLDRLRTILARHGFTGEIIGVTPRIEDIAGDAARAVTHTPRGYEIQAWIDAQPEPPQAFVILDDNADMEHLEGRLVQTSFERGLEDHHVEAALVMLASR